MSQIQDLRERCQYLLILFKAKNMALYEKYSALVAKVTAEKSAELYHFLLLEYKKLLEGTNIPQPQKPMTKKVEVPKAVAVKKEKPKKKAVKKASGMKKSSKKITKKPAKKVAKKVVKKKAKKSTRK